MIFSDPNLPHRADRVVRGPSIIYELSRHHPSLTYGNIVLTDAFILRSFGNTLLSLEKFLQYDIDRYINVYIE